MATVPLPDINGGNQQSSAYADGFEDYSDSTFIGGSLDKSGISFVQAAVLVGILFIGLKYVK